MITCAPLVSARRHARTQCGIVREGLEVSLRALEVSGETEPTLSSAEVDNGLTSVEAWMHSYHNQIIFTFCMKTKGILVSQFLY